MRPVIPVETIGTVPRLYVHALTMASVRVLRAEVTGRPGSLAETEPVDVVDGDDVTVTPSWTE